EDETPTGRRVLLPGARLVDAVERRGAVDQVVPVEDPLRHRVEELARPAQRLGHPTGDVPGVDACLLRLRVDGHDPAGPVADEIDDGVRELPLATVDVELCEEHRLGPRPELPLTPRLV